MGGLVSGFGKGGRYSPPPPPDSATQCSAVDSNLVVAVQRAFSKEHSPQYDDLALLNYRGQVCRLEDGDNGDADCSRRSVSTKTAATAMTTYIEPIFCVVDEENKVITWCSPTRLTR